MQNTVIRNATFEDIPAILEIVNHAILHTTSNYNYEVQSLEVQTKWFEDKVAKNFPIIVAVKENQVIGFGTYGTFREKIGYQFTVEHSVYVTDSFIGKGIGKLLLENLIELAKNQKLHAMIGAIDAENKASIAFHEKFGFEVVGNIRQVAFKFDRWLDLVLMELIL
jgi:L-amino acid N-acyltransferase YncA